MTNTKIAYTLLDNLLFVDNFRYFTVLQMATHFRMWAEWAGGDEFRILSLLLILVRYDQCRLTIKGHA